VDEMSVTDFSYSETAVSRKGHRNKGRKSGVAHYGTAADKSIVRDKTENIQKEIGFLAMVFCRNLSKLHNIGSFC